MKREDKDLKLFILALAIVLSLISIRLAFINKQEFGRFLKFGALLLFAIGMLRPKIFWPVYRCWMVLAKAISTLITAILLILVFYLVITPIGLFLRLFGKDLLGLKMDDNDSYWFKKEESISKESYLKQY
jgi:hypothetical protein